MKDRQFVTNKELEALVRRFARRAGLDWSALADQCTEVVVFGSYAAGLQTPLSDLDMLLVSRPGVVLTLPPSSCLDFVIRTEDEVHSADWLKSELAGHIATYGRWIQGTDLWRPRALEELGKDSTAAKAKRRRISRLIQSLRAHWDRLTPDFRTRNLITLRREKQRLGLLESGLAVPPTRLLDAWAEVDSRRRGRVDAVSSLADVSPTAQ